MRNKKNKVVFYNTERNLFDNLENERNKRLKRQINDSKDNKGKKIKIITIIIISIIALILLSPLIYVVIKFIEKINDKKEKNGKNKDNDNIIENKIETEFSFKTVVGDLIRIFVNQQYNITQLIEGQEIKIFSDRKTYYDIYILNATNATKENELFYSTIYTCAISIVKECISKEDQNCVPQTFVDISGSSNSNLKRRRLNYVDNLKDIPIPLCVFELTDNDVILSISCPESFPESIIKGMVLDLYFFRPPAIKRPDKKRNNVSIDIKELEGKKTFIRETNGGLCDIENGFNSFCTTEMNTTKDEEENLEKYDEIAYSKIIIDENNMYEKNKLTNLEDISKQTKILDKKKHKEILDKLLPKLEPYFKHQKLFSSEQFEELYDISKNNGKNTKRRNLNVVDPKKNCSKSAILFEYNDLYGANILIKLKDDSGIGALSMKAYSDIYFNNYESEIIHNDEFTNLSNVLNELMSLSEAGNQIAYELYENIKYILENITLEIPSKFQELNNLLVFKDLKEVFDSKSILDYLNKLPNNFIEETNNLKNKLEEILKKINEGKIDKQLNVLNDDITGFLQNSLKLINKIFNNLKELSTALNSEKNQLTKISTYYLNHTTYSCVDTINDSEIILKNYYIRITDLITSNVEKLIKLFENNINNTFDKLKGKLNLIYKKIENDSLIIENAEESDYENIKTNILNICNYIDNITNRIIEFTRKKVGIKENGYIISDNDINKNSMNEVINEGKIAAQKLDDDESIDKTFDSIMTQFRENITKILLFMNDEKERICKMREEPLNDNLFKKDEKDRIKKNLFEISSAKIINEINQNDYIEEIDKLINDFIKENNGTLKDLIFELDNNFDNNSLIEIANLYQTGFNSYLKKVENEINQNENFANEYMVNMNSLIDNNNYIINQLKNYQIDEVHIPKYLYYWSKTHYVSYTSFSDTISSKKVTQGYINKYNTFIANIQYSQNYIKNQLFLDLINQYKEPILKLREILQSIKNNKLSYKYQGYNDFEFMNSHIETVNNLYNRLNEFLSDDKFNKKYLQELLIFKNNITNNTNNFLNKIIDLNNQITKIKIISNDYNSDFCVSFSRKKTYTCTNGAIAYKSYTDDYCCPLFSYSNNHNKLVKHYINTDSNMKNFNNKFNDFYNKIKNITDNYNKKINDLNVKVDKIISEAMNQDINLEEFNRNFNSILNEKYGDILIKTTYNFFKEDTEKKIGNSLNIIYLKWSETYEFLKQQINNNLDNFKYSTEEFYFITNTYEQLIRNNITKNFFDSIILHQRNEINYTISYYYNYILKQVNSSYHYIINRVQLTKKLFNPIIEKRKNEVSTYFNDLMNNITKYKNEALNSNNQIDILNIEEEDYFHLNSILKNNIDKTKINLIKIYQDIYVKGTNNVIGLASKYYLENSNNGKQIEDLYGVVNDGNFIFLNPKEFKDLIFNNWVFEQDEFNQKILKSLNELNELAENNFKILKSEFKSKLEKIFSDENFTLVDAINKINDLYIYQIKTIEGQKKVDFKNKITEVLNKVENYFKEEKNRLETSITSYNNDFSKINNTIQKYKEEIFNKINEAIFNVVNELHNNIKYNIFERYYNKYLNEFTENIKLYINKTSDYYKNEKLLNSTYCFGEEFDKIYKDLIENYNKSLYQKMNYLFEYKLKNLIDLEEIKILINNSIDSNFDRTLYKSLKNIATTKSGIDGYTQYDLSENIKKEIDSSIYIMKDNLLNIINSNKGVNFQANNNSFSIPDFSKIPIEINFKENFDNFTNTQENFQNKTIKNLIKESYKNNFNNLLYYLIPSFGNDFFERNLKYNTNIKITGLYNNLKYGLTETMIYYILLYRYTDIEALPSDLKKKYFI